MTMNWSEEAKCAAREGSSYDLEWCLSLMWEECEEEIEEQTSLPKLFWGARWGGVVLGVLCFAVGQGGYGLACAAVSGGAWLLRGLIRARLRRRLLLRAGADLDQIAEVLRKRCENAR